MNGVKNLSLPLNTFSLDGKVNDTFAIYSFKQEYHNPTTYNIETSFSFPTDPSVLISKMLIKIGDNEIEAKIMEREKAEKKYEDAIAKGNTAAMAT